MQIDIWSDLVCPWCYIGKRRFERALKTFDRAAEVEVVHHAFQLDLTAPRGQTRSRREMLMAKYRLTEPQVIDMDARMEQTAAAEGLEYHLDAGVTGNTFDAHRVVRLALERGLQDAAIERLYRAYFTEQRSLFDTESLVALAADAGLDAGETQAMLDTGTYADAVTADLDAARALGITGVPFFVLDNRFGVSGAQPPDVFEAALIRAAGDRAAR